MLRSGHLPFVLAVTAALPLAAGDIVINELHYDPEDKTVPEEFIELYNRGEVAIDLSGWFFSSGVEYSFPGATTIAPGEYLVIAEDPATLQQTLGAPALGPYVGRLANEGERVVLRNASGAIEDEVDYRATFPWPIASTGEGCSMELIHPDLDNDLGGSWRPSGLLPVPPPERRYLISREAEGWRYRKGTSEASDPVGAWTELDFVEDDSWMTGQASIGFGDDDDHTVLDDMEDNYISIFLRKKFSLDGLAEIPATLKLSAYVDDGAIVWINGVEVLRIRMPEGEQPFDSDEAGSGEARWTEYLLGISAHLRPAENVLAMQVFNTRLTSNDLSADAELFIPGREDFEEDFRVPPTPGAKNSVYSANAPPQIRQVAHLPRHPGSGEPLRVLAKVTDPDGVAGVLLYYQIVRPGEFIPAFLPLEPALLISRPTDPAPPNPDFELPENWSRVAMVDDGTGGDERAGDSIYTARIPGQVHRTLVRYRIEARDSGELSVRVPLRDDPSLNFASFVYDGVPEYVASQSSVHPEGPGHVYPAELMRSLPVYIVLTRNADLMHCLAYSSSFQIPKSNERARDRFNWECAFVYNGEVYDHVTYRLRQANDRYGGTGKRSFRFRFRRGRYVQLHDNYGRPYPTLWRTINTGKMFDNKRVGNFGLTEKMNNDLWNLVGVPAPFVHTFHLRIVDGVEEAPAGANGQYLGDFWGMHIVFEDYDARFMDAHGLEDGNLYKLKDGQFRGNDLKRNQGRFAVTSDADFQNIRSQLRPERDVDWLNAHVNYDRAYPYHAVVEAIRHYDFKPADTHSKNRAWYFEPDYSGSPYGRLWNLPWDSDASWGPNWNSGIDYTTNAIFAGSAASRAEKASFRQDYRNVLREFRDLVWTEEVINTRIDDLAAKVIDFSVADRDRFRLAPPEAGRQDFGPIEAKIADMKRFAFVGWSGSSGPTVPAGGRARHLENLAGAEGDLAGIPETPVVGYVGPPDFPMDELDFRSAPYVDPQGDALVARKWRIGEIQDPEAPGFDPTAPRVYEYPAVWESDELVGPAEQIRISPSAVLPGHRYRVRSKVLDATGRWSHWSEPVEFVVGPASSVLPAHSLRVTEIMYNPRGDDDYEFIEIRNIGAEPVDLGPVHLALGIEFDFSSGSVRELDPGQYVVVVKNLSVFRTRYDTGNILIAGQFRGRLDNDGDEVELCFGRGVVIQQFGFLDDWYPSTDGPGFSLVAQDESAPATAWSDPAQWFPSGKPGGSPGMPDAPEEGGLQRPANINQDGSVNVVDAIVLLRHLFFARPAMLPCGDGTLAAAANRSLLDVSGDATVDASDGVYLIAYLFLDGPAPVQGPGCIRIPDCPDACSR